MNKPITTGLLSLIMLLMSSIAWAEDTIEMIQLNHRSPSDIMEQVHAFMPQGTTARSYNNMIIVKASPAGIKEIRSLIETLDTPLQRVKITVLNSDRELSHDDLRQLSTDIWVSNRGVSGSVSVDSRSGRHRSEINQTYQAQGIAGSPIFISMGRSIPQQERYLVFLPYGGIAEQVDNYYLNVNSGFQAVVRVQENSLAIVDVHPVFSRFTGYDKEYKPYQYSEIVTQISGTVGSWIKLGQIDNEINVAKRGATRYHSDYQKQQTVYLKVDVLN